MWEAQYSLLLVLRTLVRERLVGSFGEEWVNTGIRPALENNTWQELEKHHGRTPGRSLEELLEFSHLKDIINNHRTDVFQDLFPTGRDLEIKMQIIIDIRNKEIAHPPNTDPSASEFENCMTMIEAMLEQVGDSTRSSSVRRLRSTALGRPEDVGEYRRRGESDTQLPAWLRFVETLLSERSSVDAGWVKLSEVTEYVASAHPDFRLEVGTHPQQLESDISRFPGTFEITVTDRSQRRTSPFVRLVDSRPRPQSELPDWVPPLKEIVRRSSDSGRTASRLRPKLRYAIDGFDEREYGYTTVADLVASRKDVFYLSHRKGGKVFVSLRYDVNADR